MDYDLIAAVRARGITKSFALKTIVVPVGRYKSFQRTLGRLVAAWVAGTRSIMKTYDAARRELVEDSAGSDTSEALAAAEAAAGAVLAEVLIDVEEWLHDVEEWHRKEWAKKVKAGAGVDVFPFISNAAQHARIQAFMERMTSLIRSIDEQARKDVAEMVWRGVSEQTPRRDVAKLIAERLSIAKRRAMNLAVDQSQKLAAELTRVRQLEAGIEKYQWRHSGKVHYRQEHKNRDGQIFNIGEPVGDEPGMKPFCGCQGAAWVDLEDKKVA